MTTKAGKRLFSVLDKLMAVLHGIATADLPENIGAQAKTTDQVKAEMQSLIAAIEAEAAEAAATHCAGLEHEAQKRAVAAERERIRAILAAPDLWLGVELLAIQGVTFSEPMVSVSGARKAILAHLDGGSE